MLDAGSIIYRVDTYYMKNLDGDYLLGIIENKIRNNEHLTDQDILTLALSPLMNGRLSKSERTIKSIDIADSISEETEKLKCLTLLYALFEKVGDEKSKSKFKEVIGMTDIGRMLTEEAEARGKEIGKAERAAEILTKQLIKKFHGIPEDYIDKIKKLPEEVIDVIATDIFDINTIEELEKYFK